MKCPQLSFAFKARSKAGSETTSKADSINRFLAFQLKRACRNEVPNVEGIVSCGVELSLRSLELLDNIPRTKTGAKANSKTDLKTGSCTIPADESSHNDIQPGLDRTVAHHTQSLRRAFGQLVLKAGRKIKPCFHFNTPRYNSKRHETSRDLIVPEGGEVERHGFIALPPEVRVMIYELSFNEETVKIPTEARDRIQTPALLHVNSEIRREAEAVYYGKTRFGFEFNRGLNLLSMSTNDFSGLTLNVSFPDITLEYLTNLSSKNFNFITKLQLQYWAYDSDVMSLMKINVNVPNNGPASYTRSNGSAVHLAALDIVLAELSARHAPGKLIKRDIFTIADAMASSMVQED